MDHARPSARQTNLSECRRSLNCEHGFEAPFVRCFAPSAHLAGFRRTIPKASRPTRQRASTGHRGTRPRAECEALAAWRRGAASRPTRRSTPAQDGTHAALRSCGSACPASCLVAPPPRLGRLPAAAQQNPSPTLWDRLQPLLRQAAAFDRPLADDDIRRTLLDLTDDAGRPPDLDPGHPTGPTVRPEQLRRPCSPRNGQLRRGGQGPAYRPRPLAATAAPLATGMGGPSRHASRA